MRYVCSCSSGETGPAKFTRLRHDSHHPDPLNQARGVARAARRRRNRNVYIAWPIEACQDVSFGLQLACVRLFGFQRLLAFQRPRPRRVCSRTVDVVTTMSYVKTYRLCYTSKPSSSSSSNASASSPIISSAPFSITSTSSSSGTLLSSSRRCASSDRSSR